MQNLFNHDFDIDTSKESEMHQNGDFEGVNKQHNLINSNLLRHSSKICDKKAKKVISK